MYPVGAVCQTREVIQKRLPTDRLIEPKNYHVVLVDICMKMTQPKIYVKFHPRAFISMYNHAFKSLFKLQVCFDPVISIRVGGSEQMN